MSTITPKIIVLLLVSLVVVGCAGRTAAPVMVSQYGDEKKSCKALKRELQFIEGEISRLIPETDKTNKNVALGVAGALFLVPWFFMDLSQAEQIEINALRQRYNNLLILSEEKNCSVDQPPIPDFEDQQQTSAQ